MTGQGLPILSGHEVIKKLKRYGYEFISQKGSHVKLRKTLNPEGTRTVIVPNHKEIEKGTLKEILRQADLNIDEFLKK